MKRSDAAVIGALGAVAAVCFYPLFKYYFAQDDFMLIRWAVQEPGWLLERMFGRDATYFRPLTMFGYFAVAGRLFGTHPLPWHLVSLVLHLVNTVLVYALLVRLRLSRPAALVGSAAFGLNLAFFHAVAWITCTQQLLATTFSLGAVWFWMEVVRGNHRAALPSFACYLGAGLSLEQTYFLPLALLAAGVGRREGTGSSAGRNLRRLWPHLALMLALVLFRVVWKGTPDEGRAAVGAGWHPLVNLWKYLAAVVTLFPEVPGRIELPGPFDPRALVVPVLVVYSVARERWRQALFAGIWVLAMLGPALALRDHAFYYHTYLAGFGAVYLLALLWDDLLALARRVRRYSAAPAAVSVVAAAALAVTASIHVRSLERAAARSRNLPWKEQTSFVLHRALLAATARDDILAKVRMPERIQDLRFVLFVPQQGVVDWGHRDMHWALGQGALANVVLSGRFDVRFDDGAGNVAALAEEDSPEHRVLLYDPYGHIYTPAELRSRPDRLR